MSSLLRPSTEADIPTVARLMSEHWPEPADAVLVRRRWSAPSFELRRRGLLRAGLGVDAESVTGANRLYEQAGMHVAGRVDIYEKVVE